MASTRQMVNHEDLFANTDLYDDESRVATSNRTGMKHHYIDNLDSLDFTATLHNTPHLFDYMCAHKHSCQPTAFNVYHSRFIYASQYELYNANMHLIDTLRNGLHTAAHRRYLSCLGNVLDFDNMKYKKRVLFTNTRYGDQTLAQFINKLQYDLYTNASMQKHRLIVDYTFKDSTRSGHTVCVALCNERVLSNTYVGGERIDVSDLRIKALHLELLPGNRVRRSFENVLPYTSIDLNQTIQDASAANYHLRREDVDIGYINYFCYDRIY